MTIFTKSAALAAVLATSVSGAAMAQSLSLGSDTGAGASVGAGNSGVSAEANMGTNMGAGAAKTDNSFGAESDLSVDGSMDTASDAAPGTSGDMTYGQIVSSIRTGTNTQADIAGITPDAQVETMTLSSVQGEAGENAQALDNSLDASESELTEMRDMISANADFAAMLEADGYTADDVIGVYETADGSVEVLIDDRS